MGKHRPNYYKEYYQNNKERLKKRVKENQAKIKINRNITQGNRLKKGECKFCNQLRLPNHNRLCEKHWFVSIATFNIGIATTEIANILKQKLVSQNYKCPYTGEILIPGVNCHLDHIYSKHRFPELKSNLDNVEWVSEKANIAKQTMTKKEFTDFCGIIYKNSLGN